MNVSIYQPKYKVRIVTAASLFDGHDAAINIMRRIIQATGCEVIHLGHDALKPSTQRAIARLKAAGIKVVMLSFLNT